jgi:hypothetical protein
MHSVLLVIKRPASTGKEDADRVADEKWWNALRKFDSDAATNKGCEILNSGTYLIRANDGLKILADGIGLAHGTFEYKVLFFDECSELPD